MKLAVNEVFTSIQGEGPSIGMPCVFLRLSGCNLACSFCDTKYSWDGSEKGTLYEVVDLYNELRLYRPKNLVVTGGEPLLQQEALSLLIDMLAADNWWFEIETNGTIVPNDILDRHVGRWNVSPKLQNSGLPREQRLVPRALDYFAEEDRSYFKFVVSSAEQVREIDLLDIDFALNIDHVYLMPEGTSPDRMLSLSRDIAEVCIQTGYYLAPRLHILLWGNRRGR